jgi:hypothetical protein
MRCRSSQTPFLERSGPDAIFSVAGLFDRLRRARPVEHGAPRRETAARLQRRFGDAAKPPRAEEVLLHRIDVQPTARTGFQQRRLHRLVAEIEPLGDRVG